MLGDLLKKKKIKLRLSRKMTTDIKKVTLPCKIEGNTGAGWVITSGDYAIREGSTHLGKESTVFQAEAVALLDCLIELSLF